MTTQKEMLEASRVALDAAWHEKHPSGLFYIMARGKDQRPHIGWLGERPTSHTVRKNVRFVPAGVEREPFYCGPRFFPVRKVFTDPEAFKAAAAAHMTGEELAGFMQRAQKGA